MSSYNIYVPTIRGKMTIDCKQVMYVESAMSFSRVVYTNNEFIDLLLTVDDVELLLSNQGFYRFNNRYLVNLYYVQVVFPSDASKVVLENGKEIFVNHNKRDELFEHLREVYDLYEFV